MPDISIVGENIEESWKAVRMMENTGSLAVSVLNMRHSTFMGCDGVWQRVLDVGKGWQPGSTLAALPAAVQPLHTLP